MSVLPWPLVRSSLPQPFSWVPSPLAIFQTGQSLLITREACPETYLIGPLSQHTRCGGHLMALVVINHYLFICVLYVDHPSPPIGP